MLFWNRTAGRTGQRQGLPVPEVLYRDGCSTYTLPSPVPALVRILTYLEGDLIKTLGSLKWPFKWPLPMAWPL